MDRAQSQALERLRELARDPVASAYLVGVLIEQYPAAEWPDLVQAALVFRERFDAASNHPRKACVQAVAHVEKCDRCAKDIVAVCAAALGIPLRM